MNFKSFKKRSEGKEDPTVEDLSKIWDEYAKAGYEITKTKVGREMADAFTDVLDIHQNGRVLDGGCGAGLMFKRILDKTKANELIAVDYSEEMLKKAYEKRSEMDDQYKNCIKIINMDLTQRFAFPNNYFDAEIFHLFLYYWVMFKNSH